MQKIFFSICRQMQIQMAPLGEDESVVTLLDIGCGRGGGKLGLGGPGLQITRGAKPAAARMMEDDGHGSQTFRDGPPKFP